MKVVHISAEAPGRSDFVVKSLIEFAWALQAIPLAAWLVVALEITFGATVSGFELWLAIGIAAASTGLWCQRHGGRWRFRLVVISGTLAIASWLSLTGAGRVFEGSYDALWYHQEAVIQLADGWNPVHSEVGPDRVPNPRTRTWLEGYGKSRWYAAAATYRATGRIETAKGLGWLFSLGTLALTAAALVSLRGIPRWFVPGLAIAIVANPIAIAQAFNLLVDGELVMTFVGAISGLVLWMNSRSRPALVLAMLNLAYGAGLKHTAPCMLAILVFGTLAGAAGFGWCVRWRSTAAVLAGALGFGVLVGGFSPYVTNMLRFDHPFFPIMGPKCIAVVKTPPHSRFQTFVASVVSRSNQAASERQAVKRLTRWADVKPPFCVDAEEIAAFRFSGVRIGGWGPLFSGALVLASGVFSALAVVRPRLAFAAFVFCLPVVATTFLIPFPWLARYVPQVWWLPLIPSCFAAASGHRVAQSIAAATVVVALSNAALVAQPCLRVGIHTRFVTSAIETLRRQRPVLSLEPFRSWRVRLAEHGVDFVESDDAEISIRSFLNPRPVKDVEVASIEGADSHFRVSWSPSESAPGARIEFLLPPPAGPGGGRLTAMRRTVEEPETTVHIGPIPTLILIRPCWDFVCSPKGEYVGRVQGREWPEVAVLGRPEPGDVVAPGEVVFSWLPVADSEATFEIALERTDADTEPVIYRTKGLWLVAQIAADASWTATLTTATRGHRFSGGEVSFTSVPGHATKKPFE